MRRLKAIILGMVLLPLLSSCGKADDFYSKITVLDNTSSANYVQINDMDELIEKAKPNLIVRGKVASRKESTIVDYSGKYSADFLSSDASDDEKQYCAAAFLSTPYEIEVSEIFLGDEVESLTINMPYGILDSYYRRDGGYPVLREGAEYLLFLRVDLMYGQRVYYLAFALASALELDGDKIIAGDGIAGSIFGGYDSYESLTAELQAYIGENDIDISMDEFG